MIIFCGDIHGDFEKLIRCIKAYDFRDCDIIQVGDFGLGFSLIEKEQRQLKFLNDYLVGRNIFLHAIRGNHDDPLRFIYQTGDIQWSNISLIQDYTVKRIQNKNILFVGGAISIDRKSNPNIKLSSGQRYKGRKQGSTYWSDEPFVLDETKLNSFSDINIVVTHSAPGFVKPYLKVGAEQWFDSDPTLESELDKERSDLTKMYEILSKKNKIESWFYGHFHFSNLDIYQDTKFKLLDIFEFQELR